MIPDGMTSVISKLTSQQVEQVTCIECCKYYIAPESAVCGHTLCHGCWTGRRSCPVCASPLDRRALRLNIPMQTLTDHVHSLGDAFEKLFHIKLDDFLLDVQGEITSAKDPAKNVKDWLASSQNQFSAPVLSSPPSIQEAVESVELSTSKIQIHTHTKNTRSPTIVVHAPQIQEDWDKIEILPDTEVSGEKNKEYAIGPTNIEPIFIEDSEYTANHPRRSSRKRDLNYSNPQITDMSADKQSSKNSSNETDKKTLKPKQNWSNVKKMRKEFSKLNKQNRSKLNVSIEMCKKAQSVVNKPKITAVPGSQPPAFVIEDDTPDIMNYDNKEIDKNSSNTCENGKVTPNFSMLNNYSTVNKMYSDEQSNSNNTADSQSKDKENLCMKNIQNNEVDSLNHFESPKGQVDREVIVINNDPLNESCMPIIKKSNLHHKTVEESCIKITQNEIESNTLNSKNDDIEISIKIGSTITNIVIKKKLSDVQVKVNTDREVQTSLGPYGLSNKKDAACSPLQRVNVQNIDPNIGELSKDNNIISISKTTSTKKNTASAETATANFEITDSVEKELSKVMECTDYDSKKENFQKPSNAPKVAKSSQVQKVVSQNTDKAPEDMEYLDDLDIFGSGSVKEPDVQMLKNTKYAASEILLPTLKNKKSQRIQDKRDRDLNEETDMPSNKKQKLDDDSRSNYVAVQDKNAYNINDSEDMTYDKVMSQVFASIDAEIKSPSSVKRIQTIKRKDAHDPKSQSKCSQIIHRTQNKKVHKITPEASNPKECINQKYSENVFSMIEKDSEHHETSERTIKVHESTQAQVDKLLTPGMCRDLASKDCNTEADKMEIEILDPELGTPQLDHDDDDKSVVEETPQKNLSFSKLKQKSDGKNVNQNNIPETQKLSKEKHGEITDKSLDSQIIKSIINISDTSGDLSKHRDMTIIEIAQNNPSLETPLNINKFVNQIKHNSTPVAKKSLNFDCENNEDPEQTLCPTTTQEKEFLTKAFEQSPAPIKKPLGLRNVKGKEAQKFCIAGSCLTAAEVANIKCLCLSRGWTYFDKYNKDLTHLVVGVDEENKSQRSVKYMCALAASKWIVSYDWILKCQKEGPRSVVDEMPFEALDAGGDHGPRRSRMSTKKLFEGIKFYCMPPFSVLDLETLKFILEAAGGQVVEDAQGVRVVEGERPALLLAEPESTQEDRFIYLAMELCIVPVNYEWVLNCLGTYSLGTLHDLLLCPSSLLPPPTKNWPAAMMLRESEEV